MKPAGKVLKIMGTRIERATGAGIFGTDASGYDNARADYPAEMFDAIDAYAGGIKGRSVFEVGPGTGIASRALLRREPARLTLIEPDPVLARGLQEAGFETVESAFETAELQLSSYDIGLAASCIHWVDPERSHVRARDLLRADGTWAICWNVYRSPSIGDPFADLIAPRLATLPLPPSEAADRHYSLDEAKHRADLEAAGLIDVQFHIWRRERVLSATEMRALYASFSFVRALPEPERIAFLDETASVVERDFNGNAPNVVLTPLYLARAPSE